MTSRLSFRVLSLAFAAALGVGAVAASAQGSTSAAPTSAQRRALLLDPSRPYWRTQAPDTVRLDMETSKGTIVLELIREWAPNGVDRFYNLARAGFFDDTRFYRVIMFYIAQFGHPASPAVGAAWRPRKLRPDSVRASNVRGTLSYAQFNPRDRAHTLFINLNDNVSLDSSGFAPIGRVIEGMDVADRLNTEYGELPASPAPLGNPRRFYAEANRFLDKEYPALDRILSIKVREDSAAHE
jgi:peptidyl-prolyl cis-trans isomerase A (cyclophilin A)